MLEMRWAKEWWSYHDLSLYYLDGQVCRYHGHVIHHRRHHCHHLSWLKQLRS